MSKPDATDEEPEWAANSREVTEHRHLSVGIPMLVAAWGAVALLSAAACLRKIWATDFWWQIATGRWVLQQGWPEGDVFSYTVPGAEWIELRWLVFSLGALIFDRFGPAALVLLKWIAVVITLISLLAAAGPRSSRRDLVTPWLVAVGLLACSQRLFVRPELASYLLFALFLAAVARYRAGADGRWLWWLPLLQLVWVNSHPLYFFGPATIAWAWVAEQLERRLEWLPQPARPADRLAGARLPAVGLACVGVCLLNPYGWHALLFPLELFQEIRDSTVQQAITELQSPFAVEGPMTALRYYKLLIALALGTSLWNWRRPDPFWIGIGVAMLYLSATSIRSLPLFCWVAIPWVLVNVDRAGARPPVAPWARRPALRAIAWVSLSLFCGYYVQQFATHRFYVKQLDSNRFGLGLAEGRYPAEAIAFLDRTGVDAPVFGSLLANNLLLASGRPVFADSRTEVYGDAMFRRFLEAGSKPDVFSKAVEEFGIGAVVTEPGSVTARMVHDLPGWRWVAVEASAVIYLRDGVGAAAEALDALNGAAELDRLADRLAALPTWAATPWYRPVAGPNAALVLADQAFLAGHYPQALRLLDLAERAAPFLDGIEPRRQALRQVMQQGSAPPPSPPEAALPPALAQALERRDWAVVDQEARRLLEQRPDDARLWGWVGRARLQLGDVDAAGQASARALQLDPQRLEYRVQLADAAAAAGMLDAAIQGLEIAYRADPRAVPVLGRLAALEQRNGNLEAARRYAREALALEPEDPQLLELAGRLGLR